MILRKIFSTNQGFRLEEIDKPSIGVNDVLIEIHSSFFSPGTETASAQKLQEGIIKKALRFKDQIRDLISKGDFETLLAKVKKQTNIKTETGYSVFGKILAIGKDVTGLMPGQYVVAVGEKASHGSICVCPKGLVFPCDYNLDYSAAAVVSIALNAVYKCTVSPFSKILVLGGGMLGQIIIQLLSKSGHNCDLIEIRDELKEVSMDNGCGAFYSFSESEAYKNSYDCMITTLPFMDDDMWNSSIDLLKIGSEVILVGAANISVQRNKFYPKKIAFNTVHSYGYGRGDYDYEINGNHNVGDKYNDLSIRNLIEKSLDLISQGILNFQFVDRIFLDANSSIVDIINGSNLGLLFVWNDKPYDSREIISESWNLASTNGTTRSGNRIDQVDVLGNSSFFNDSHKRALAENRIAINKIFTRSPRSNSNNEKVNSSNLIISTPHIEHWNDVTVNLDTYENIFVDKPLIISKKQYEEYTNLLDKNIICLMNRRYSIYTEKLKDFINERPETVKLYCNFNVPEKNAQDPIYFNGGRLIGEMCHHVDLAIYLNGPINEMNFVSFDGERKFEKIENCVLFLNHESGAQSEIGYTTSPSPFYKKECVWATRGGDYLVVNDFASLRNNKSKKGIITYKEKDKGVSRMWNYLKNEGFDGNFNHCRNIDSQTYSLLNTLFF